MPPEITILPIPTGGAFSLSFSGVAVSGVATLTRTASGQSTAQIYSGPPINLFIDVGDGLPGPLDPATYYQYQYTDSSGNVTSAYTQPARSVTIQPEPITGLLIRLLQAGILSATLPSGIERAQVTHAMPLGGAIKFPLVVVNLDVFQQSSIPIGQSTTPPEWGENVTIMTGFARYVFRVSVLAGNAQTRDYYRALVVTLFEAIYATVLQPIGIDVTHRWQVSSGQVANDRTAMMPGFFFADTVLEFEGTFNAVFSPDGGYGLIERITLTATDDGQDTVVEVPVEDA